MATTVNDKTLGYVCFSENITGKQLGEVRKAAQAAGIGEQIKDVRDRNAFIRAIQKLKQRGAIESGSADGLLKHKLVDDDAEVTFQFSKYFIESQGATYDSAALIRFNKKKGEIVCANAQIKELAEQLFDDAHGEFRTSDLNAFITRVIRKHNTKKLPIRDGVWFVASTQRSLTEKIKDFFTRLGFSFLVLPVNQSTGESGSILKAIVTDFKNGMQTLSDEIAKLEKEEDGMTKKIAHNRLVELREQFEQYREIAVSLQVDMKTVFAQIGKASEILAQACMPVDQLIAEVQTGKRQLQPVISKLMVADELISPEFAEKFAIQVEIPKEAVKVSIRSGEAQGVDLLR